MRLFKKADDNGLYDWWMSSFSSKERMEMIRIYQPMGADKDPLVPTIKRFSTEDPAYFLSILFGWFKSPVGNSISKRIMIKLHEFSRGNDFRNDNILYSPPVYVEDIKQLKREGLYEEAAELLKGCIKWQNSHPDPNGIEATFYHEELAKVYRKLKRPALAEEFDKLAENIYIKNYFVSKKDFDEMPSEIREKYFPGGMNISKDMIAVLKKRGINP